jgi:hypothetical protein
MTKNARFPVVFAQNRTLHTGASHDKIDTKHTPSDQGAQMDQNVRYAFFAYTNPGTAAADWTFQGWDGDKEPEQFILEVEAENGPGTALVIALPKTPLMRSVIHDTFVHLGQPQVDPERERTLAGN